MLPAISIVLYKAQKFVRAKLICLIMGKTVFIREHHYETNALFFLLNAPAFYANGRNLRNCNELVNTDTELSAIAPAASMGESSQPVAGYSKPAAIGIPITL